MYNEQNDINQSSLNGSNDINIDNTYPNQMQNNSQNVNYDYNQQNTQNNHSSNQFENNSDVSNTPTKYKLTLCRKKSFVGSVVALDVNIDNQKVGTIKNGETLELDITAGSHTIYLSKESLLVSVDPNNAVNIEVNSDITADVVLFGANNFGITNISGQGINVDKEGTQKYFEKNKKKSNLTLVISIIFPIVSVILFISSKLYITPWVYGIVIGYAIVNLVGLKTQKGNEHYKSNIFKNILAIIISILFAIVTIYISVNEIESFDELFNKNNDSSDISEYDDEEEFDDETEDFDDMYNIPDYFKLNFSIPSGFSIYKIEQDPNTNLLNYIYQNNDDNSNFYRIGLMRLNSEETPISVVSSLRNGYKEQLLEETNNVSDFKYESGSSKTKNINNKQWNEFVDVASSNSLNFKITIFMYGINYEKSTYMVYGIVTGDLNSVEPAYSNFVNSLKF